jgi:hypothetical protein
VIKAGRSMVRIRVRQSNSEFVEVDGQQLAKGKR